MSTTTREVMLPADFEETERGNIWLMSEDGTRHNAWIRLTDDHWLEIEIRPDNYPGLSMATIRLTGDDLLLHILAHCGGMSIRRLNLPGAESLGDEVPEEQ